MMFELVLMYFFGIITGIGILWFIIEWMLSRLWRNGDS